MTLRCRIMAGTDNICIRNIVINFSEKFVDIKGRKARVIIAVKETCFNTTFTRPNP